MTDYERRMIGELKNIGLRLRNIEKLLERDIHRKSESVDEYLRRIGFSEEEYNGEEEN